MTRATFEPNAISGSASAATHSRRTTLQDIAKELNVSTSLVSKVLNRQLKGRSSASREKVQAIFDKARELDYQKNVIATSLVRGRQDSMAVYVHEHGVEGSEITSRTIKGVAEQSGRLQQRLMLHYYANAEEFARLIPMAHRSYVDGLILIGISVGETSDSMRQIIERRLPVVTIYDRQIHPDFPNIGIDQIAVAKLATEHLIERGCRRIAFIGTRTSTLRHTGYCKALADAGLPYDERLDMRTVGYTADAGEEAMHTLRTNGVDFDGVVGQSDQHAAGAINALIRVGVRVPEQVKIMGIDNSPFCKLCVVPITSVSQESAQRGELAATTLLHLVQGEAAPSVVIPPRLFVRASSGG